MVAKNRRWPIVLGLIMLVSAALSGCSNITASHKIIVSGSTTVMPLVEVLAHHFMQSHPDYKISVGGGGSSIGIAAVLDGISDLGSVSRDLKPAEIAKGLIAYPIAIDGIAIIVNNANPISDLSLEQIRNIFNGTITNWSTVGGTNRNVIVIAREEGSGSRDAFDSMIMGGTMVTDRAILQGSNGAIKVAVMNTPGAIGFISLGQVSDSIKTLSIDGVAPTIKNIRDGSYTLQRYLYLVSKGEPTGAAKEFLDFILSEEGQKIVAEEFISVL